MSYITIHESGAGADKLRVDSYYNGGAYNISFGEAGAPMRNIFFQGDDASQLRAEFDAAESASPHTQTRDVWLSVIDPYL